MSARRIVQGISALARRSPWGGNTGDTLRHYQSEHGPLRP